MPKRTSFWHCAIALICAGSVFAACGQNDKGYPVTPPPGWPSNAPVQPENPAVTVTEETETSYSAPMTFHVKMWPDSTVMLFNNKRILLHGGMRELDQFVKRNDIPGKSPKTYLEMSPDIDSKKAKEVLQVLTKNHLFPTMLVLPKN